MGDLEPAEIYGFMAYLIISLGNSTIASPKELNPLLESLKNSNSLIAKFVELAPFIREPLTFYKIYISNRILILIDNLLSY